MLATECLEPSVKDTSHIVRHGARPELGEWRATGKRCEWGSWGRGEASVRKGQAKRASGRMGEEVGKGREVQASGAKSSTGIIGKKVPRCLRKRGFAIFRLH